ncbi:haloacid dehalogenase [Artomyces pyxidatus]|uniref:Haloacid dehalogenase n=1 Tax=Artomyces pyxidatus TaxID=48021 RepID=A0ACB8SHU0_9AGAM|nr:haloacid dehalogenase [Artomyces pyxidatus]
MSTPTVLAFDVLGTLLQLSTGSTANAIQKHLHVSLERAKEIAAEWEYYQTIYTFRLNSMGEYQSYDEVARKSLQHVLLDNNIAVEETAFAAVLQSYWKLSSQSDALDGLKALNDLQDVKIVFFSNGTEKMITSSLGAESLLPLGHKWFFADSVRKYKPAPEIYHGLLTHLGKSEQPGQVWLVSSSSYDVQGALHAGMGAIWVDREGKGWTEQLFDLKPTKIVRSLEEVAVVVKATS